MSSIIQQSIKASIWSTFSELLAKLISPLVFLLLTRILTPEDYGIVAVATTILGFVYVITDLGANSVIIQYRNNDLDDILNVAFWMNLIIGGVLCVVVFILADYIANILGQDKAGIVIRVMAIQIIPYSLCSVQTTIKKKYLDFKTLFYIRIVTVGVPAIVSIPIALLGGGYWAIIWGSVTGSFFSAIVLWMKSEWRPALSFKHSQFKYLFSKSLWDSIEQLSIWIPMGLDTYLITKYLSVVDLGLYTTSRSLFSTISGLIFAPIIPVMFSTFSKLQKERSPSLNKILMYSQTIITASIAFVCTFVFIYRDVIAGLIFTNKWDGIAPIIGIIFLIMGFKYTNALLQEVVRADGRFKELSINSAIVVIIEIPILFIAVNYGIIPYVIARCCSLYLYFPYTLYLVKRSFNISPIQIVYNLRYEFIISIILILTSLFVEQFHTLIRYSIDTLIYMLFMAVYIYYRRKDLNMLLGSLRKK